MNISSIHKSKELRNCMNRACALYPSVYGAKVFSKHVCSSLPNDHPYIGVATARV